MVIPPVEYMFEDMWESAKDVLDFGGLKVSFDLRQGLTKSQFVEKQKRMWYGSMITKDGEFIIPHCGIYPKLKI